MMTRLVLSLSLVSLSHLTIRESFRIDLKSNSFILAIAGAPTIATVSKAQEISEYFEIDFVLLGLPFACVHTVTQCQVVSKDVLDIFQGLLLEYRNYEQ